MNSVPEAAEVWASAGWHLYQFDFARDACEWLRLDETGFRDASFLDQRVLEPGAQPLGIPLAALRPLATGGAMPAADCIFHIGHCGSTLVSRALAASPAVLPVREPLALRQLASAQEEMQGNQWHQLLQLALAAYGRSFHAGQRSMIKATSTCNALLRPAAGLLPAARMLLMYVPLESYLAGMLGKQQPARDLLGHAPLRLQEWRAISGQTFIVPAAELDEVRLAVLSWLTAMSRLLQAADEFGSRCQLLDFEQFLAAPEESLESLVEFFGLQETRLKILQAWPEISLGYSKQPDQAYSAFNRERTLSRGRLQRGPDIRAGLAWAGELLDQHPVFRPCRPYF